MNHNDLQETRDDPLRWQLAVLLLFTLCVRGFPSSFAQPALGFRNGHRKSYMEQEANIIWWWDFHLIFLSTWKLNITLGFKCHVNDKTALCVCFNRLYLLLIPVFVGYFWQIIFLEVERYPIQLCIWLLFHGIVYLKSYFLRCISYYS